MELVMAFATIVQLLGMYSQETNRREDLNSEAFMRWLVAHNHNDLRNLLVEHTDLQAQLNTLLRQEHVRILTQLERLSDLTLSIAGQIGNLTAIQDALPRERRLPTQALEVLQLTLIHGPECLQRLGSIVALIPSGATLTLDEPQFIDEDCDLLVELGYFRTRYDSRGETQYLLTRAGADFARRLPPPPNSGQETSAAD